MVSVDWNALHVIWNIYYAIVGKVAPLFCIQKDINEFDKYDALKSSKYYSYLYFTFEIKFNV